MEGEATSGIILILILIHDGVVPIKVVAILLNLNLNPKFNSVTVSVNL